MSVISANETSTIPTHDENKESISLIWFDPNIGSREDTEQTKQQLRLINDYVIFRTDLEQCISLIQSINNEKIFLITSGSRALELLPVISALSQIDSIFIYCMKIDRYQHLISDYSKTIGIYNNLNTLCTSIREQIDLVDKQLQAFSFFDQHQQSTTDLAQKPAEFLWFHLFNHIILRLPRNQQAKQQMINICRQYYRGNTKELSLIDQFDREYRSEEAIRWYSKDSFVYRLVNKALRSEDIDQLHTFRFLIGDLSESLAREHEKILLSEEELLTVYRGVKLDKEEFDKLKENQGSLISTNGYLSTSRLRLPALTFAMKPTKRTDVIPAIFEIKCNIKQLGKSVIFADIAEFSEYPSEQEVLFGLSATFQLECIEEAEGMQIIRMNASSDGESITKDYLEIAKENREERLPAIALGRLMCNFGQYEKSQKYFEQLLKDPNGEDIAWIEFNIGRALDFKGEWNEARIYYDRAYDRMAHDTGAHIKDLAYVVNNIGGVLQQQGKYADALQYYQRSLEMLEKCFPSGHLDIAYSLKNIGSILDILEKYDEALDYYQRSLEIKKKYLPSGHIIIASSLNNIGGVLNEQGQYDEALHYHQQALRMQEKYYPSGHVEIALTLNNIGCVYDNQGKYAEALECYQRSLKIKEKYFPSGHVDIGRSLNNIGCVLDKQGEYPEAFDYHQRALKMREEYYSSDHADIAGSLQNIGHCLHHQEKYNEALDYYQRALKIQEKYNRFDHVDNGDGSNHSAVCYKNRNKSKTVLNYYQRALKMQERYYPLSYVDSVGSLYGIGNILAQQGNYNKALDYYQRVLKLQEQYYPSGHVDIAHCLNNIGMCYENQNNFKTALDYHQRALNIYEEFLPIGHLDRVMASTIVVDSLEKYERMQ